MRVDLRTVGHRFGDGPWLFRGLDASLEDATVTALVGPSGSGKSSLLALLAGWHQPAEGSIVREPGGGPVVWVMQGPLGVPARTALDHVSLPLLARGATIADAEAEAHALLGRCRMGERAQAPFRELSGGEAQRLMLARALAASPSLLLIDEPTAQLDRETSRTIDAVIASMATEGVVVVVATHDPETAQACGQRLQLDRVASAAASP